MSKVQIGDIVKFLDEVGGGKVIKILDSNTALVETEDGFQFPYPINKLVVTKREKNYEQSQPAETTQQEDKPKRTSILDELEPDIIKDNDDTKIYLALVPKNPYELNSVDIDVYLVNDSNWHLLYIYQTPEPEKKVKSTPGHLQPNMLELLITAKANEIVELKSMTFQILFFRRTSHIFKKPLMAKISFKPEKIFNQKAYIDNIYFETKALFYPILEEQPLLQAIEQLKNHDFHKKVQFEKEVKNQKLNQPKQFKSGKKPDTIEVDLHITELLDDTRGMTPKDMLEYQMQVFKDKLEEGLKDPNIKRIIFIHGKGNGTLKQEIRSYLDRKKIPYQDASFAKYGFGATMVFVDNRKTK